MIDAGVLGDGARTPVPILSVNTHSDPLVPIADTLAVAHASKYGEIWFAGDSGHCPTPDMIPRVVDWLLARLGEGEEGANAARLLLESCTTNQ